VACRSGRRDRPADVGSPWFDEPLGTLRSAAIEDCQLGVRCECGVVTRARRAGSAAVVWPGDCRCGFQLPRHSLLQKPELYQESAASL